MYVTLWIVVAIGLHFVMKKQYPLKDEWSVKKKQYHQVVYFYMFPVLFAPALIAILSATTNFLFR